MLEHLIKSGKLHPSMTFSQKVWTLTSRIPPGKVATYASIAKALKSRAPRAVGNALNKNPYAPQVPCHRVVGSDGSLTGYALGLPKKRALLKSEGVPFRGQKVDLEKSAVSSLRSAVKSSAADC
jgi:methylated-DNA-[protein]-cysteine S-methyltransferase